MIQPRFYKKNGEFVHKHHWCWSEKTEKLKIFVCEPFPWVMFCHLFLLHNITFIMVTQQYTVEYTNNKHAYLKVLSDWSFLIRVPYRLKHDTFLVQDLLQRWKILQKKIPDRVQVMSDSHVSIWWESIDRAMLSQQYPQYSIQQILQQKLAEYAQPLVYAFASQLWKKVYGFWVNNVRRKWGSCTHDDRIMLNQSLIHFPKKYTDYVIIHECCHLVHKNHSQTFRNLVQKLCPEYKTIKKEMKWFHL